MTQASSDSFANKKGNQPGTLGPGDRKPIVPYKGFGLGLRPKHYTDVFEGGSSVSWYEVVTENFLGDGGRPLSTLEKIRRDFPIAFHGVSGSLGSTDNSNNNYNYSSSNSNHKSNDGFNLPYFKRLKNLMRRFDPFIISDHCCWTRVNGQNFHDLLPLPFTQEAAKHVSSQISRVQDYLGRKILIENVSSYLSFAEDEMTEWEFLTEILTRSDCGLLLDINNIYVSSVNHGFDPLTYIGAIPKDRVGQIHLAGHSTHWTPDGLKYLIDTHDHPICDEVWTLYSHAIQRLGKINTMVEWDANIPEYSVLEGEISKARQIEGQHAKQLQNISEASESSAFEPGFIVSSRAPVEVWKNDIIRSKRP